MRLVDTHCHLHDSVFDADRDAVLERALEALSWLVLVGDTIESSQVAARLTGERVFAAVGVHPYHADSFTDNSVTALRRLIGKGSSAGTEAHRVVAIGEIGLDYYHMESSQQAQEEAFRRQLELAVEAGLPVVIHNRDAHDDVIRILQEFRSTLCGGVMHCFSGDARLAEQYVELGFYISFAGNVTFPKASELRDAAAVVPMDRLVVETDSPYLAPQPVRGKRCEPAYVVHTAQRLAELKSLTFEQFAASTTANAETLFSVSHETSRRV